MRIAFSIARGILKAIRAGVGFGSGTETRERRGDKMFKDELAQLLKQRKERAAIIGQTRVRGERERVCLNVFEFWWERELP